MATVAKSTTFALKRGSGSPISYTTIPGVKSFEMGNIQAAQLDATDFDSSGDFREFVNGYKEASEGSFVLNFDSADAVHEALRDANGGDPEYFEATYGSATVTFTALITGFSTPVAIGEIMEATVTIKLTGEPVWA
jgi:hypothetical protein